MALLKFNVVLRIEADSLNGFFRIAAMPAGADFLWLAYIGHWGIASEQNMAPGGLTQVEKAMLEAFSDEQRLSVVDFERPGSRLVSPSVLKTAEHQLWMSRCRLMQPFFDHAAVCDVLTCSGGLGPLVRKAMENGTGSRATVYRLWALLCIGGFDPLSLVPRFERCGAPGVPRPITAARRKAGAKPLAEKLGLPNPHPQVGLTAEDRQKLVHHYRALSKPGKSFQKIYQETIERAYVSQYRHTESGLGPVLPPPGTFPNMRQFRHAVEYETKRIERVQRQTTRGHYERNLRGLRGRSYDGVAGPGHVYAIDSTIGDIHLRSSINRAWPIGRPIVYIVVDVWSTAIVGFYVCLSGPSWDTAKVALFSACSDPKLLAELWGYEYVEVLYPAPTVPYQFMGDRGEYLSLGARETCALLAINFLINAAYRPDLK